MTSLRSHLGLSLGVSLLMGKASGPESLPLKVPRLMARGLGAIGLGAVLKGLLLFTVVLRPSGL